MFLMIPPLWGGGKASPSICGDPGPFCKALRDLQRKELVSQMALTAKTARKKSSSFKSAFAAQAGMGPGSLALAQNYKTPVSPKRARLEISAAKPTESQLSHLEAISSNAW